MSEPITITTSDGATLHTRTYPLTGVRARARLVLLHGYGDHSGRYEHFAAWLVERGIAIHTFDFRGMGQSSGARGFVARWDEYLTDLETFLDTLPADGLPLFILGHSHGGLVLAIAGIRGVLNGRVAGCLFSAPYLKNRVPVPPGKLLLAQVGNILAPSMAVPTDILDEVMTSDAEMLAQSRSDPNVQHIATPRWFLEMQRAQAEAANLAGDFRLPLLMLIAGKDELADEGAIERFVAGVGSEDKAVRRYEELRHELLRETDREAIFTEIFGWMENRLVGKEQVV